VGSSNGPLGQLIELRVRATNSQEDGGRHGPFEKGANPIVKRVERQAPPRCRRRLADLHCLCPSGDGAAQVRIGADEINGLILVDPAGSDDDGFYYIASWPTVVASNLEAERQILARRGVLGQLTQSCRGELPFR
jgi:hypothetical protein